MQDNSEIFRAQMCVKGKNGEEGNTETCSLYVNGYLGQNNCLERLTDSITHEINRENLNLLEGASKLCFERSEERWKMCFLSLLGL